MSVCHHCHASFRARLQSGWYRHCHLRRPYTRPTFAPRPAPNLKHIRQNPGLYEQNCNDRHHAAYARNGWRILELHEQLVARQKESAELRQRNNAIGKEMKDSAARKGDGTSALIAEAKMLKAALSDFEKSEKATHEEMERLALELPNLSSLHTPVGDSPEVLGYINGQEPPEKAAQASHVDIGRELNLLDFEASATTTGWGWYFLKNEAALLEQALIQFALSVALKRGWQIMTPPSLVYGHIASACGFMPRDQHGETQIYHIGSQEADESKGSLVLAGTAEIPFAGSQANKIISDHDLPMKVVGPSRCYRAEAGARGVDTKGLYRVHEFTKVEMFAWAKPPGDADGGDRFGTEDAASQAEELFEEMVDLQREILSALNLHARILEMPTADLGASATRKIDIEAYIPSRTALDKGYGEVTSASICTDYQARRLNTRVKSADGRNTFAHTVNGTAMAVPRVLAAILENGWDEGSREVVVPACLRRWMPGEMSVIGRRG
ncbi:mitochondrial serine--tRNA ligase [Teratosphaeria destructans]|uniref:serine--tRNA ligase n=1 Tax=Teratosphaeria destructans TaxID=418781 RepID=A0A9W7SSY1_9PEZI|nr:mitochondrial serine--tRNA ligase [Teratosphaeria destructans]